MKLNGSALHFLAASRRPRSRSKRVLRILFCASCVDKPHSLEARLENRARHLTFLNCLGARVKIGVALLGPDHQTPVGPLTIFEYEILALVADDPYSLAGQYESVSAKPWRQGVGHSLT